MSLLLVRPRASPPPLADERKAGAPELHSEKAAERLGIFMPHRNFALIAIFVII
jgi:hypothetical protein